MKAITIICITIVLGISIMQDVDGGKIVSEKKLESWSKQNENINKKKINLTRRVSLKNNNDPQKQKNELQDFLEVIQYVITNAINNQEFRTFLIKRFLHNYIPQDTQCCERWDYGKSKDRSYSNNKASDYLNTIKKLKKKINPKSVKEDDESDEAMKNQ